MKFRLKTTNEQLGKMKAELIERYNRILANELSKIGLDMVTAAREKQGHEVGGFNDQTGNLRASIGYLLLYDGSQIVDDFGTEIDGASSGLNFAKSVSGDYPKGWCLIIVAGMEYATYVEDLGYDVISGSTLGATKLLKAVQGNLDKAFS